MLERILQTQDIYAKVLEADNRLGSRVVVSQLTITVDRPVALLPSTESRCFLAGGHVLNLGESVTLVTLSPEDQTLAADVILLVDESSSMVMEHDWIPGMIRELDTALQVRKY